MRAANESYALKMNIIVIMITPNFNYKEPDGPHLTIGLNLLRNDSQAFTTHVEVSILRKILLYLFNSEKA